MPAPNGLTEKVVAALLAAGPRGALAIHEIAIAACGDDELKSRMKVTTTLRRLVSHGHARSPARGVYTMTAAGRRELAPAEPAS